MTRRQMHEALTLAVLALARAAHHAEICNDEEHAATMEDADELIRAVKNVGAVQGAICGLCEAAPEGAGPLSAGQAASILAEACACLASAEAFYYEKSQAGRAHECRDLVTELGKVARSVADGFARPQPRPEEDDGPKEQPRTEAITRLDSGSLARNPERLV